MLRLLRQPGGFEGIGLIEHVVDPHNLPASESEHHVRAEISVDAAGLALAALVYSGQNRIPGRSEILSLNRVALPLRERIT